MGRCSRTQSGDLLFSSAAYNIPVIFYDVSLQVCSPYCTSKSSVHQHHCYVTIQSVQRAGYKVCKVRKVRATYSIPVRQS